MLQQMQQEVARAAAVMTAAIRAGEPQMQPLPPPALPPNPPPDPPRGRPQQRRQDEPRPPPRDNRGGHGRNQPNRARSRGRSPRRRSRSRRSRSRSPSSEGGQRGFANKNRRRDASPPRARVLPPPQEVAAAAPPPAEAITGPNEARPREPAAIGALEKVRTNGKHNQAAALQQTVAGKPLPTNLDDDATLGDLYSNALLTYNSEELAPFAALEGTDGKDSPCHEDSEEEGEIPLHPPFHSLPDIVWIGSAVCPYNMAIGNSDALGNPYKRLRATTASFAQYRSQQLHKRKDGDKGTAKVLTKDWIMAAQHMYKTNNNFKEYFDGLSKNVFDLDNGGAAI
jgi:hypothetical protein